MTQVAGCGYCGRDVQLHLVRTIRDGRFDYAVWLCEVCAGLLDFAPRPEAKREAEEMLRQRWLDERADEADGG